jgi:hypothetical protein
MPTPSVPFTYPDEGGTPDPDEKAKDALRALTVFINERVICRKANGALPDNRTIVVRLIVLNSLLYPEQSRPLAAYARELKCSRAWMSKVGLAFADSIGMRASWQRMSSRAIYAQRARGVHAGTWQVTHATERKKLRARGGSAAAAPSGETTRQNLPSKAQG